jgi:hypothetical protein
MFVKGGFACTRKNKCEHLFAELGKFEYTQPSKHYPLLYRPMGALVVSPQSSYIPSSSLSHRSFFSEDYVYILIFITS